MGVGQNIAAENANWIFGGSVPDTFVDHIKLSVPLYEMGTSTGELIHQLAKHNAGKPDARWIDIDAEKARSLKSVLEPFSTQGNPDMLDRAGFKDVMSTQKYICFEGFLAIN